MNTDVKEETEYYLKVLSTFKSYREQSLLRIRHRERCLNSLPYHHKKWLNKYREDIEKLKEGIEVNATFIPNIIRDGHAIFENVYANENVTHSEQDVGTLSEGLDKVQSVFKQLMRDWSALGAEERKQCYEPIIQEIFDNYPEDKFVRSRINVLVPGAGLGRLVFEIASGGFSCEGNEFNLFMILASYFVLNLCKKVDEYEIFPWIHQYTNNLKGEDQMISARFPDVIPTISTPESSFSMTAGDFLEVYDKSETFHCIATCFFIDCAPNVVQFIETIYRILKPGGLWINLGPLLYHYSDMKNEKSIEPSFQVVTQIISKVGFDMEKCQTGIKTKYCQNPRSMLQYEYDSVFFVCRKPANVDDNESLVTMEESREDICVNDSQESVDSSMTGSQESLNNINMTNGVEKCFNENEKLSDIH